MSALHRLGIIDETISSTVSESQLQTETTFGYKWNRRESYETDAMKSNNKKWLIERYLDNDPDRLNEILKDGPKIILDVGCGSGFSGMIFFNEYLRSHHYLGIEISNAINVAKIRFKDAGYSGDFLRCDLMNMPIPEKSVDVIFSEGVLHHTDNTEAAIKHLAAKLKTGGKFLFYVYRKKAVIREFTDDFIREHLKPMTDEDAWNSLESLTKLGMELGKLNMEIEVPEDVPFLGIPKGKIDIQRFFYWNIFKAFYKPEYSLDENNHINFDWYRPLNCHRHTPEEIVQWCSDAQLTIDHINLQEAGITVVATRK